MQFKPVGINVGKAGFRSVVGRGLTLGMLFTLIVVAVTVLMSGCKGLRREMNRYLTAARDV